ncbi:MAG: hypothetical protein FJY82_13825 [Candidatus Aminicenantes bacterium]|nr:hypothetical protein [Candidatus Aminicenantes bacterium]
MKEAETSVMKGWSRKTAFIIGKSLLSSLRRRYLYYFRRDYVDSQIRSRRGDCQGCGAACCLRTRKCFYVKDGKCSIYATHIPRFCKIFPVDPLDIRLASVEDVCQFHWE